MSTTVTTHHHRTPWIASAAVAAVIAGAGLVSLTLGNAGDSVSNDQAPSLRTPTLQDYAQYNYYHGARPWGGLDGHVAPAPPAEAAGGQSHVSAPPATIGGLDGHVPPAPPPATTSGGRTQIGQ
jgi:hypothetical protein